MISGKLAVLALALMVTGCDSTLQNTILTNGVTFLSSSLTALLQSLVPAAG
jgi:hypothetical protein